MGYVAVLPPIKSQVRVPLMNLTAFKEINTQDLIAMARALPGGTRVHIPDRLTAQPGEPGYSEYYGLVHYPEWTPALQASVEALPNDYVSEQGHSKLDLLQFLKLCKEQTIQDAVDRERINREYEQRQRADAAEAERKRSLGYQFWHRLWNAIFSGFTLGLFLAFFGAWFTLSLWDKPVHGALAGLASAVLYGFFKPVR
jgi:hypothetical protein